MSGYAHIPAGATLDIKPFTAHVPEGKLQQFRQLLELSPIAPTVFENTNAGSLYGLTRAWLQDAKRVWLEEFDWRKHEARFNSFPSFTAAVQDSEGNTIDLQFLSLFSQKEDAVPIVLLHGWPSSNWQFFDLLDKLRAQYSPENLPYHVIVPSLPGYAYSSGPPVHKDYGISMAADAINSLMVGLGFGDGYITQGGDLGSFVSRALALNYDACKGMHVNMMGIPPPSEWGGNGTSALSAEEKQALEKASEAIDTGFGFALEQGTRPATIGLALSTSPLALLSWIGEKLCDFSNGQMPLDTILQSVTLYWLTDTYPRSLWHNRDMGSRPGETPKIMRVSVITGQSPLQLPYVEKPCGYSLFAQEIVPVPRSWAEKSCNLVMFHKHERGGHTAAMERPEDLLCDIEEFVAKAWKPNAHTK